MSGTHASASKSFRLTKKMRRAFDPALIGVDVQDALAIVAREFQRRKHRHKLRLRRLQLTLESFVRAMKRVYGERYERDLERMVYDKSPMLALVRSAP